ncbi:MAG: LruC domain-containing protein [Leptospiraceae bacterium]|nr:LruC domain-containing protein [Leptospiraceae bacterium]MCP5501692.1 LruC domain-containing protein [Leptospiraceae bacterium]
MKTFLKTTALLFLLFLLPLNCKTQEDPGLLWLLNLGNDEITLSNTATGETDSNSTGTEEVSGSDGTGNSTYITDTAASTSENDSFIRDVYSIEINDVVGTTDFIFDTTKTIELSVTVLDTVATLEGTAVRIIEKTDPYNNRVIFQAVTNENGSVKGNFTINTTTDVVYLEVHVNGQVIVSEIKVSEVNSVDRKVLVLVQSTSKEIVDRDGDGIEDSKDDFPDDPTRATLIKYPSDGTYYTVAFEDLFPKQGDADFNDYVVRVRYEEELNASGKLVNLKGFYQHVAKGAGYNHTFNFRIPLEAGDASFTLNRLNSQSELLESIGGDLSQKRDIEILGNSKNTISQSNTSKGQVFKPGNKAELSIHFTNPVDKTIFKSIPFDIFLYVINTKYEIHFAGRYLDENNKDKYLDPVGFPWAAIIPGDFAWPYECQNIHNAYEKFYNWYSSSGANDTDWYKFPDEKYVFPVQ